MSHSFEQTALPKVLYTYDNKEGELTALIINRRLDDILFWHAHEEGLFLPRTPEKARTAMFNDVMQPLIEREIETIPPGSVCAASVQYKLGYKRQPFLHIHLTAPGHELVRKKNQLANREEYTVTATHRLREKLLKDLPADLLEALKICGMFD